MSINGKYYSRKKKINVEIAALFALKSSYYVVCIIDIKCVWYVNIEDKKFLLTFDIKVSEL